MGFDDPCDEAQSQAETLNRVGLRVANAIEAVEDVGKILGRYADTGILHGEFRPSRFPRGTHDDADSSAFGRVFYGVRKEIREQPLDLGMIRIDRRARFDL